MLKLLLQRKTYLFLRNTRQLRYVRRAIMFKFLGMKNRFTIELESLIGILETITRLPDPLDQAYLKILATLYAELALFYLHETEVELAFNTILRGGRSLKLNYLPGLEHLNMQKVQIICASLTANRLFEQESKKNILKSRPTGNSDSLKTPPPPPDKQKRSFSIYGRLPQNHIARVIPFRKPMDSKA